MAGKIEGTVTAVTEQGNLVTSIHADQLNGAPRDERVSVRCDAHETNGIFNRDHSEPQLTLLAVLGEDERLQLEIVGESAAIMLGVGVGARVVVSW